MSPGAGLLRLFQLPLRHPRVTLGVLLVVTAFAALGWRGVRFEPDVSRLLPQDHPQVEVAALLDEGARPSRTLWILLRGQDVAERVGPLAAALRASPLVAEVAATREALLGPAAARARAAPVWTLPDPALARLAEALSAEGRAQAIATLRADLADDPLAARELAVRDPLGLRWLWAEHDVARQLGLRADSDFLLFGAGDRAILRLTGTHDAYDVDYAVRLLAHVEQVLDGVDAAWFGGYAVARGDQARVRRDFEAASLWSMLAIAGYLCWAMRGLRLPLLVQMPAALSIAWAVPFASAWFGPLPTVAVAAVAVLGGLGVDFAIHYAARYREARLHAGHDEAVRQVQQRTVPELLIDMLTTAVTFLAVGFGQRGGLAAFGWLLALGLGCSVLLTTTALPILLRFAGERRDPERSLLARLADRWLAWPGSRRVAHGALGAAAALAVLVGVRGVPLSADGEAMRPAHDPVLLAREQIEATLGFGTVPAVVLWPEAQDPSRLWAALQQLRADGRVRFWSGLERIDTEAGRRAVAEVRARTSGWAEAARQEYAAAGFQVAELEPAFAELAASLQADPATVPPVRVTLGGVPQRVVMLWPGGRLDAPAFAALRDALGALAGPQALLHGSVSLSEALAAMLRADLLRACGWAALLAAVMVTVWLRSLRVGLLALLPSAIGLVVTLAGLSLLGLPLTLVSFVAIPFVLGIGVDEGVHLVGHFRHGAASTGATGVGVVRTSLGTMLGFGALGFADSPALAQLGGIVAFGAGCSMLACLFVLAPLLARAGGR